MSTWAHNISNTDLLKRFLYAIMVIYMLASAFVLFNNDQYLSWDSGVALKMAFNSDKNIPFNHYAHPAPSDLSKDDLEFVTWWTPGQFAVPMVIQRLLNVKFNTALKLTALFCLLITASGVNKLFGLFINNGHSTITENKNIIRIFLMMIMTGPYVWGAVNVYDGGGMLMLAYAPWFIYGVARYGTVKPLSLLVILAAGLAGFFLKASFTAVIAGALCYLFFSQGWDLNAAIAKQDLRSLLLNALSLSITLAIYLLITKFSFLDHNRNISDSSLGIRLQGRVVFFPIAAPFLNTIPTNVFDRTIHWVIVSILVLPVCYLVFSSRSLSITSKTVLACFGGVTIMFYMLLYLLNVDVSYEARHFSLLTVLILPMAMIALANSRSFKYLALILAILMFASNIFWFTKVSLQDRSHESSINGAVTIYPSAITAKLHELDSVHTRGTSIFYFKSNEPSIALLIRQNRVLLEDNFINFRFNNNMRHRQTLYYGAATGDLYITYPEFHFKQDSVKYLTRFERYKKFNKIFSADGYGIFKAVASDK